MDHDDVLEQAHLAAVEPRGLERLMAGDTPTAAAVAGHLAGCQPCGGEVERVRRAVPLLRDVIRTTPPADLRQRTLATVRERGVARGGSPTLGGPAGAAETAAPIPADSGPNGARSRLGATRGVAKTLPWAAAIAAAVVLSVGATALLQGRAIDSRTAQQDRIIASLERVIGGTLDISADPATARVALATRTGTASGTLLFSPTTSRLLVVATGLVEPPAGQEYRCWVEIGGVRQNVGRMFFARDLAYWVGDTPAVADLPKGTTFGVSLSPDGSRLDADPVLVGRF